jgi:hypothetical protein|tara:strand:- start:11069 stop:11233 length:165 start_codon:yes stop_codon:yes gene_type:complete
MSLSQMVLEACQPDFMRDVNMNGRVSRLKIWVPRPSEKHLSKFCDVRRQNMIKQ